VTPRKPRPAAENSGHGPGEPGSARGGLTAPIPSGRVRGALQAKTVRGRAPLKPRRARFAPGRKPRDFGQEGCGRKGRATPALPTTNGRLVDQDESLGHRDRCYGATCGRGDHAQRRGLRDRQLLGPTPSIGVYVAGRAAGPPRGTLAQRLRAVTGTRTLGAHRASGPKPTESATVSA